MVKACICWLCFEYSISLWFCLEMSEYSMLRWIIHFQRNQRVINWFYSSSFYDILKEGTRRTIQIYVTIQWDGSWWQASQWHANTAGPWLCSRCLCVHTAVSPAALICHGYRRLLCHREMLLFGYDRHSTPCVCSMLCLTSELNDWAVCLRLTGQTNLHYCGGR